MLLKSSTLQPLLALKKRLSPTGPNPVRPNASLTFAATSPPPATSAYVHLPFCRKRCHYCDFPIVALGSSSLSSSPDPRIQNYASLLLREIHAPKPQSDDDPFLKTVFFGGGTPSLVPPSVVSDVLRALQSRFGVEDGAEVSMEMDPGTFGREKIEALVGLGVNRVSLGVQAFQDELLRTCGRAHGLREVEEAIEIVRSVDGLVNWSVDLISSLPHQSLEMWEETLRLAVDAAPTHVSVYDLQVEQGTKFGQLYTPGEFPLPSENQSADFYKKAVEVLTKAGYEHYEISSYCKRGFECKHNLTYWQNKPFYAFGLGSTSFINGKRFSRPRKMGEYTSYVQNLDNRLGDQQSAGTDQVEAKDVAMDVVMLSLRTARGLDVKSFAANFGLDLAVSLGKAFEPYVESGHVVLLDEMRRPLSKTEFELQLLDGFSTCTDPAFIRLSDPEGFLLSNELISTAFRVMSP